MHHHKLLLLSIQLIPNVSWQVHKKEDSDSSFDHSDGHTVPSSDMSTATCNETGKCKPPGTSLLILLTPVYFREQLGVLTMNSRPYICLSVSPVTFNFQHLSTFNALAKKRHPHLHTFILLMHSTGCLPLTTSLSVLLSYAHFYHPHSLLTCLQTISEHHTSLIQPFCIPLP